MNKSVEYYGDALCDLAKTDSNIVGLTADLTNSTGIKKFKSTYPNRFFNIGIAEQNMFGIAAGMAKIGLIPFVSTFAVFASMRGLEQIRTDICYQNLNVKVIGTHAGLSFGQAGTTHHCTEDISIMRTLSNFTVIVPSDGQEIYSAVREAYKINGPVYIRINRGKDPIIDKGNNTFSIGKAQKLREGEDVTFIACGRCVNSTLEASDILKEKYQISANVLNMHTIKPIDYKAINQAMEKTSLIVTVEDHNVTGGLGSAVAEVISNNKKECKLIRLGIPDKYCAIGQHSYLMNYYEFDTLSIVKQVSEELNLCTSENV